MRNRTFTVEDLRRILRECAGEDESADLNADISDATFEDLGYDSLALLETANKITREFAIAIADDDLAFVDTPGELVKLVNRQLASA
jgi:act minimal PKS acyl carrier protein